jgi:Acyl-CoA carboxylase epsilon subunit
VSDASETNDSAPASETAEITETTQQQPHGPFIRVLKGHPTDAELAALIVVLGSAGGVAAAEEPESTRWGLPVDGLRYAISNFQRVTLQQRLLMRR